MTNLHCKGNSGQITARQSLLRKELVDFLGDHANLPFFQPHEHKWIMVIVGNQLVLRNNAALSPNTADIDVTLWLVLIDFVSALLTLNPQASPFHHLLLHPQSASQNFLPTMPDDPRIHQAEAAIQRGEGAYLSARGHVYNVADCRWPMEIRRCNCGEEDIGGQNHTPVRLASSLHMLGVNFFSFFLTFFVILLLRQLPNNKRILKGDGSSDDNNVEQACRQKNVPYIRLSDLVDAPRGYQPETPDRIDLALRNLSPTSTRLLRLFTNLTLVASTIFNPKPGTESRKWWQALDSDWTALRELFKTNNESLTLILHGVIHRFASPTWCDMTKNYSTLTTVALRNEFERLVASKVLEPTLQQATAEAAEINLQVLKHRAEVRDMNIGFKFGANVCIIIFGFYNIRLRNS